MADKKIRAAVVGYGNIGRYVTDTLRHTPDFELAGVVRRNPSAPAEGLEGVRVAATVEELGKVDVAILCTPTREVEAHAVPLLERGINTVDSFDIHTSVSALRSTLGEAARKGGAVAVLSAGWDPGTDSMVRAILEAAAPRGITYTNFGPGMSMGHSVCARSKQGVRDAMSLTVPLGTGIHRRMVYVELEPGATLEQVTAEIKADPYFASDETHVIEVESVDALRDMGHGVHMTRKAGSGTTQSQRFEFSMAINNPALTAQVLVASARASMRQAPGAYTLIEIAPVDLLPGTREANVARLV